MSDTPKKTERKSSDREIGELIVVVRVLGEKIDIMQKEVEKFFDRLELYKETNNATNSKNFNDISKRVLDLEIERDLREKNLYTKIRSKVIEIVVTACTMGCIGVIVWIITEYIRSK